MNYFTEHVKEVKNWGIIRVARVIPKDNDLWGAFAPLKGTDWESLFTTVTGEALSEALYGYLNSFLQQVGDLPSLKLSRIGVDWMCASHAKNKCGMRLSSCYPGSQQIPMCYKYPRDNSLVEPVSQLLDYVKSDYYIVLVSGEGFTVNTKKGSI